MKENPDKVIQVTNLTFKYLDFVALANVSFNIGQNEIIGLLGPNGAGKTTLINVLSGISKPSAGQVSVLGHDITKNARAVRSQIALIPQRNVTLDLNLNVFDNLYFYSMLNLHFDRKNVDEVLEVFGLDEVKKNLVMQLSGGMKRKLILSRLALSEPKIIFLDEPTVGVDIYGKRVFANFLRGLKEELNATVIITTHDMEEAESICDKVLILNKGQLLKDISVQKIKETYFKKVLVSYHQPVDPARLREFELADPQSVVKYDDTTFSFLLVKEVSTLSTVLNYLERFGRVVSIVIDDISLEDYFRTVVEG